MNVLKKNKYSILSTASKYVFVILIACSFMFPLFVAQAKCVNGVDENGNKCGNANISGSNANTSGSNANTSGSNANTSGSNANTTGSDEGITVTTGIQNPLGEGNYETIPDFIVKILNTVLLIMIPIVALAIIYSGFLFVTAAGNSEKLKKAKATFLYTIIGAAIILGSIIIAEAIKGTVDDISSKS